MKKNVIRFSPFFLSCFYGALFSYFIASSTGEEIYGFLYNSPLGPAASFFLIFCFFGSLVQALFEYKTYRQHKTPRQPSPREQKLIDEVNSLKAQVGELHKELAKKTPLAM